MSTFCRAVRERPRANEQVGAEEAEAETISQRGSMRLRMESQMGGGGGGGGGGEGGKGGKEGKGSKN